MSKPEISKHLIGHYKMAKGYNPGKYTFKNRTIDFTICTLDQANEMAKLGISCIIKEEQKNDKKNDKKQSSSGADSSNAK